MKHVVYGMVCTLIVIFMTVFFLTIQGRTLRQAEAERALAESVDAALSNLMEDAVYPVENADLFAADLLQSLLAQTNSTSDVTVSVLEADVVHGILSVEITETYRHPNGNKGTVSACRTVIFDREVEEEEKYFTVSFYTGDKELYKSYRILEHGYCSMPKAPKTEGKRFQNWRFVTGGAGVASAAAVPLENGLTKQVIASSGAPLEITGDVSLVAVFE